MKPQGEERIAYERGIRDGAKGRHNKSYTYESARFQSLRSWYDKGYADGQREARKQ